MYVIEEYVAADGKRPFGAWLLRLKDKRAQAKLRARFTRASHGNFGDWKAIAGVPGLREMREHYGPGYRVYFAVVGRTVVLLLAGSTKKDQARAIAAAEARLTDYRARSEPDGEEDH